jgi:hypothetical protein
MKPALYKLQFLSFNCQVSMLEKKQTDGWCTLCRPKQGCAIWQILSLLQFFKLQITGTTTGLPDGLFSNQNSNLRKF